MTLHRPAPIGLLAALSVLTIGCMEANPLYAPSPQLAPAAPTVSATNIEQTPGPASPPAPAPTPAQPEPEPPEPGGSTPTPPPPAPAPAPTGKLCDPCDPYKPSCTEPGGLCVLNTTTNEAFCSKACDKDTQCPTGYVCADVEVPKRAKPSTQCVPATLSCKN